MDIDELIRQKLKKRGYDIQRELGRGGYGITYLTTAPSPLENLVVIKSIKNDLLQMLKSDISALDSLNQILKSFKNEADILLNLEHPHPNIVKVFRIFSENLELPINSNVYPLELFFLVVEYIEGENLQQIVNKQISPLSEGKALSYIQQIGKALAVIHEKNLLHRDIKPQNIMVREKTDKAVLIDFGIAREFTPEITQSHTVMYTDPYAPPEQLRRRDQRGCYTDIYSLAATLYYLLTKQPPTSAYNRILGDSLNEPHEFNPNISDIVNQAILWGMELQPCNRPQTVEDWLEKLFSSDDLSSEKGVDYTKLRDFLKAQQWQEADKETFAVMLKASGRETQCGWLYYKDIENFPCTDLRTIDQLWIKYSDGRFGFSLQKRIWESVGKDYFQFADRVGWRKGYKKEWINYPFDVTFDTTAHPGHLPISPRLLTSPRWSSLFFRIQTCKL